MEFHQIPGRPRWPSDGAACADHEPRKLEERYRGTAVNEKSETTSDELPDRLSVDPNSPYYNAEVLARDVGIRFKGVEKTNVEEYCAGKGGAPTPPETPKTPSGNPLTIRGPGPVEPYFRDKK